MRRKAKAWFDALRLRTLPLSLAGVVVAAGLAGFYHVFSPLLFAIMLGMAASLQVLSNFADEYGDLAHGADTDDRLGPKRGLQRGDITAPQMRAGIVACGTLAVALAVWLLLVSFSAGQTAWLVGYLALMAACVAAALFYTIGPRPYGYAGLGDLSCFLFFGVVPVVGGFVLYTAHAGTPAFVPATILPGVAIGALSCGTLNLNDMRDIATDKAAGKMTFAVKLGPARARDYQAALMTTGLAAFLAFSVLARVTFAPSYLYVALFVLYARLLQGIMAVPADDPAAYDRFMKPWSMSAFLLSCAFSVCVAVA